MKECCALSSLSSIEGNERTFLFLCVYSFVTSLKNCSIVKVSEQCVVVNVKQLIE